MRSIVASYSSPSSADSKAVNWRMSVPATNAFSPAPRSTSTFTSSSASTASQRANSVLVHRERHRVERLGAVERHPLGRSAPLVQHLAHASASISSSAKPASRSTSAVCSPSSGAGRRTEPGRVGQLDRDPEPAHRALDGVLHRDLHLARLRVRVGEHLGVVVDRPGGHARLDQRRHPLVGPARGQRRLQLGHQLGAVGHPALVGGEALVAHAGPRGRSPRTGAPTAAGCCRPR